MLAGIVALTSCVQSNGRAIPPSATARGSSCYIVKQQPTSVRATITFYGWPDNSPPGNKIAHPVLHRHAGGDGTYCNPTTFATERSNDEKIPYGIKMYVPSLKQYFIREDLCTHSGPPTGSGSNGCYKLWFDLWIGGTAKSKPHAVVACELKLTPNDKASVILWPRSGMPVAHSGPLYRNHPAPDGSCDGKPEKASYSTRRTTFPN